MVPLPSSAVLKLGVPRKDLQTEIDQFQLYAGDGCARLLDADATIGAILLERLQPGTLLSAHPDDEEATAIAATIMRRLRRPVPADNTIPTIQDWFGGLQDLREKFGGGTGPFPKRLVEEAEQLAANLFATLTPPVVLHGDLHHFNILAAEGEPWLAIDPQGVIGEPDYEVGALMRNPNPAFLAFPNPLGTLERRLTILAETPGFERARLRAWTVAQGVLRG